MIRKMIFFSSLLINQAMASETDIEMLAEAKMVITPKITPDVVFVDEISSSIGEESFQSFGEYDSETNTIKISSWESSTYKQIRKDFPDTLAKQIFRGKIIHELDHAQAIQAGERDRLKLEVSAYRSEIGSWSDKLRELIMAEQPLDDMIGLCPTLELMKQNPIGFAILVYSNDLSSKRCGSPGI